MTKIRSFTMLFAACAVMMARQGFATEDNLADLRAGFKNPTQSAKPGVYWYFMDGNLSREGITADLESMKEVGIGHVVFLEVNVGVPRGHIDFLSAEWQSMFTHVVRESERLGIDITLGVGPGWTGSGGPWVKAEDSMQHLVTTSTMVSGPGKHPVSLPVPDPMPPYFGEGTLTPELKTEWNKFYRDVAVLAYPEVEGGVETVPNINEKALYYREPYSSKAGVPAFLPSKAKYKDSGTSGVIARDSVRDITKYMKPDGHLDWDVPPGNWTVVRVGARNNGAITRPAPVPGLGFESDKLSTAPFQAHLDTFVGKLLSDVGAPKPNEPGGLKALHMDSWEMGSQNWTPKLREEFTRRRGYDPLPFYPVYSGAVVDSREVSERFLWDLRLTAQELVIENHAKFLKSYAHDRGLKLSIEPYDMNPTADLDLGAVADIPMCEFWSNGYGFNSAFSCIEAASIAHVNGASIVQAEAFTGDPSETWKQYPGSMKNQGDWAFSCGINRFFYHTFAHQPLDAKLKPGMEMGPYGVHWDRNQTFWPMVGDYHKYIARCQQVLQQGSTVADILYLTPEGAPQVFLPPADALTGDAVLPDRKGFNFDGCSPGQLMKATVKAGNICFQGGGEYRVMVLPNVETVTPEIVAKIRDLSKAGATIVGQLPEKSPSLANFPQSDKEVRRIKLELTDRLIAMPAKDMYPTYEGTAAMMRTKGMEEDFLTTAPIRYTHKTGEAWDVYFVSNRSSETLTAECGFRVSGRAAELWDPLTGGVSFLGDLKSQGNRSTATLTFAPYQSYFVVFGSDSITGVDKTGKQVALVSKAVDIEGPWQVTFDKTWGGPGEVTFNSLDDWTSRSESGVRYYSGIALYRKTFDLADVTTGSDEGRTMLDLGIVHNLARVRLNGKDLGVVWTAPWQVDITDAIKPTGNVLEIEVANLWPNRLIGDAFLPDDEIKNNQWPTWLLDKQPRPSKRVAFTTYRHYTKDSPLLPSGLLGPVVIRQSAK